MTVRARLIRMFDACAKARNEVTKVETTKISRQLLTSTVLPGLNHLADVSKVTLDLPMMREYSLRDVPMARAELWIQCCLPCRSQ